VVRPRERKKERREEKKREITFSLENPSNQLRKEVENVENLSIIAI
jgi:hypothetical protein